MKLLHLFLFSVCTLLSFAQEASVQGRVIDNNNSGFSDALIYILEDSVQYNTTSNLDGDWYLQLPSKTNFTLVLSYLDEKYQIPINLSPGEKRKIGRTKFDIQDIGGVEVIGTRNEELVNLPPIEYSQLPTVGNSIEQFLVFSAPVSSNNELSNSYNVRGGNYNENLVYVNGIQIYRPFLTRSGQQEGMSFINPNFVENVAFSAGGFTANYGDRLSSVLDIQYRNPEEFHGSVNASIQGGGFHLEDKISPRFNYIVGARYRNNGYILNALPTTGSYNPIFFDFQFLTNYNITSNLKWTVLGHVSSNDYRFAPVTQDTRFGTINESYSFRVYFDGEELTRFRTFTGASKLSWKANKRTDLSLIANVFNTNESENFTIQGQYFINQLETDPSEENVGDSIATVGIGTYLDHARNELKARIYSLSHQGEYRIQKLIDTGYFESYKKLGTINWGVKGQVEEFDDKLSEWRMLDSAGYSLPQAPSDEIQLFNVIKAQNYLYSYRFNGFVKYSRRIDNIKKEHIAKLKIRSKNNEGKRLKRIIYDTIENSKSQFKYDVGLRAGYTAFNDELYLTPRASISYFPHVYYSRNDSLKRRFVRFHLSSGLYYQPPFYRELRSFDGQLNTNIKSQKSFHIVAGMDYQFEMWQRATPFRLSTEIYYKHMWDVNPYEVDNVRIRYYTTNNAKAFAYGLDFNLNGEFIPGLQSFVKLGLLHTAEDLLDDSYLEYRNSDDQVVVPGAEMENDVVTDTVTVYPGYIPRPSDQWVNFAILFQDRMPIYEKFTVQLGLNYGYKLPYGPPDFERYKDVLRQKAYFRTDVGFGYDFFYGTKKKERKGVYGKLDRLNLTFEIWNLLGIKNVLSQQWIQDVNGRYYAIPNYLTARRFNLKLNISF